MALFLRNTMIYTQPKVRLLSVSTKPFESAVSAAKTCYSSKGVITPKAVELDCSNAEGLKKQISLLSSIYLAGHHTTLQHSYLHFSIENVSRAAIWSFLHSHTFYNSEQVSQRYVKVKKDQFYIPSGLNKAQSECLLSCYDMQIDAYNKINELLLSSVENEYLKRFKSRKNSNIMDEDVRKKTQEIARYVLPIGTTAYLHHTISFLSLLRYVRICEMPDVPQEQKDLALAMFDAVKSEDPNIGLLQTERLKPESLCENAIAGSFESSAERTKQFIRDFDLSLSGSTSKLISYRQDQEALLASSIREVFGMPSDGGMSDYQVLDLILNPGKNPYYKDPLNLSNHSKAMRPLFHANYTFRKKLSHCADSQDQRHRMTPGSRPILSTHFTGEPDYITPKIFETDGVAKKYYEEVHEQIWNFVNKGISLGMSFEQASYMLPNSLSIRFSESGDLASIMHKMNMRLCYNAQEEIWSASLDEAREIATVHPNIGKYLLPPCSVRFLSGERPICPEGERFCGVAVWKLERDEFSRTI